MKGYSIFDGSTEDQIHRIGRRILKLESASNGLKEEIDEISEQIEDILAVIGDEDTEGTILYRLKALEEVTPSG